MISQRRQLAFSNPPIALKSRKNNGEVERWRKILAEIAESNVACVVQKDVLRLEVTVNDVEAVQVLKCTKELRGVKPASVLIEFALTLEVIEQLPSIDYQET